MEPLCAVEQRLPIEVTAFHLGYSGIITVVGHDISTGTVTLLNEIHPEPYFPEAIERYLFDATANIVTVAAGDDSFAVRIIGNNGDIHGGMPQTFA